MYHRKQALQIFSLVLSEQNGGVMSFNLWQELNPTAYYGLAMVAMAFIGWAAFRAECRVMSLKKGSS